MYVGAMKICMCSASQSSPKRQSSIVHITQFARVVSSHNAEVFSKKTVLCCRGQQKTDTYNRCRAVFIQEPRKFSPIDSNDQQTVFENQLKLPTSFLDIAGNWREWTTGIVTKFAFDDFIFVLGNLLQTWSAQHLSSQYFAAVLTPNIAELVPSGFFCPQPWFLPQSERIFQKKHLPV